MSPSSELSDKVTAAAMLKIDIRGQRNMKRYADGVPSDFDRAMPTSDYLETDEETFMEAMEETFQLEDDLDLEPDALPAISNKTVSLEKLFGPQT